METGLKIYTHCEKPQAFDTNRFYLISSPVLSSLIYRTCVLPQFYVHNQNIENLIAVELRPKTNALISIKFSLFHVLCMFWTILFSSFWWRYDIYREMHNFLKLLREKE